MQFDFQGSTLLVLGLGDHAGPWSTRSCEDVEVAGEMPKKSCSVLVVDVEKIRMATVTVWTWLEKETEKEKEE